MCGSPRYPRRYPCGSLDHEKGPKMNPQGIPVEPGITKRVPNFLLLIAPDHPADSKLQHLHVCEASRSDREQVFWNMRWQNHAE